MGYTQAFGILKATSVDLKGLCFFNYCCQAERRPMVVFMGLIPRYNVQIFGLFRGFTDENNPE